MSSELQRKLYSMEVEPPATVWTRLADALDEINADNRIAAKFEVAEADPGYGSWQKILHVLYPAQPQQSKVRHMLPYAMAAILVGLLIGIYFIFFNIQPGSEIAATPAEEKRETIDSTPLRSDTSKNLIRIDMHRPAESARETYAVNRNQIPEPRNRNVNRTVANAEPPLSSELEEKTFNQPLDDLSFVASNTGYMTMVNADGRLVKIPEKYSTIAPYLQDKTEYPEYILDVLMHEDAYWKDKITKWRQKLAESNVAPSYDGFFEFINLLKNIQEN